MDTKAVGKVLDVLVFGLTSAGVAKEATIKVVEMVRRSLGLPTEAVSEIKSKVDFSTAVKESPYGTSLDRGNPDSRPREARQTGPGGKSS